MAVKNFVGCFVGLSLVHIYSSVLHDVTTLYTLNDPCYVRCVAGTNTVGLPFIGPDGEFVESDSTPATCLKKSNETCEWDLHYWSIMTSDHVPGLKYVTEPNLTVWVLDAKQGSLFSPPFVAHSPKTCLFMFYYLDFNVDCEISIWLYTDRTPWRKVHVFRNFENSGKWKWGVIQTSVPLDSIVRYVIVGYKETENITVAVHGVRGCHPSDVTGSMEVMVPPNRPERFICNVSSTPQYNPLDMTTKCTTCSNGGVCVKGISSCACPPGFYGNHCEYGCGENAFGHNCQGSCSETTSSCRGMLLCNIHVGCSCASGFVGPNCTTSCSPGTYGVNCTQQCGHCEPAHECSIYSGKCRNGCVEGYYPPYCRETYLYLVTPPTITKVEINEVSFECRLESKYFQGKGTPYLFNVQYKEVTSKAWNLVDTHHVISHKRIFTSELKGLRSELDYVLRVILVDADGNSYDGDLVPVTKFTTSCIVPTTAKYDVIPEWVSNSSFEFSWKYDANTALACKLLWFNIYINDNLNFTTNQTKALVRERTFYTKHLIQVEAVTTRGVVNASQLVEIWTEQEAPSEVYNVSVKHISSTVLLLSWIPPHEFHGFVSRYDITYKAIQYLSCKYEIIGASVNITTNSTEVYITNLHAHTMYEFLIAAVSTLSGPYARSVIITNNGVPDVAPEPSPHPVQNLTPTSLTVTWLPVKDCAKLNGYPVGYKCYVFSVYKNKRRLVAVCVVKPEVCTIEGLLPQNTYEIRVIQLVGKEKGNGNKPLIITATTPSLVDYKMKMGEQNDVSW